MQRLLAFVFFSLMAALGEKSLSEACYAKARRFVSDGPVDVKYYLHTRENGGTPTVLTGNIPNVSDTHYRSDRPTKFIIHGFRSQGDLPWVLEMANALLQAEDLNVFAVDWREGAASVVGVTYIKAKNNCRTVGQIVGEFVTKLGQPPNMTHIIGHSLGAHAAGFAGMTAQSEANLTIARISGLDPAGPLFRGNPPADRLDRSDATFVDVIHTETFILGIKEPVGHVDFYPNEGWLQPGCFLSELSACSHSRAQDFFTESISSECQFLAYRCHSWDTFIRNQQLLCDDCSHIGLNGACSVMGYHSVNYRNYAGDSMYLMTKNADIPPHCRTGRARRDTETEQCVQSLDSDLRQEIRDYVDSIADMKEMGLQEDFCSMYSVMEAGVANITAPVTNCGPEDIPVILEYIAGTLGGAYE
ncbi:phospholipase A1-like isoform X2 [Branchiostoma floridae]|uniref:Phospholipase A1-like isoform X2 n=1 Tax=Branchiostoma floridae TaxID=7739 RepID=A0A9J7LB64_BRAFL|nr:phospholipase A1-like isoform X2 [Branchiostoma floridae]